MVKLRIARQFTFACSVAVKMIIVRKKLRRLRERVRRDWRDLLFEQDTERDRSTERKRERERENGEGTAYK